MNRFLAGFIGLLAAMGLSAPASAGDPDLDRVLATLKRRQEQATVVRIRAEGTRIAPKGSDTEMYGTGLSKREAGQVSPPRELKIDKKQDFLIDYPNRRFRKVHSEVQDGKLESWILAYDGTKSYGSKIDLPIERAEGIRPNRVSIHSGGKHVDFFNYEYWPHFLCHGFILTKRGQKYFWSDLRVPIDPEEIYLHGRENFRGQYCAVLRTFPHGQKGSESYTEFSIAFDTGAVRRATMLVGARKATEITIDYRTEGDRIAPMKWRLEWFSNKSSKAASWESFTVTGVEFDPPVVDETFILRPEAGTIVKEKQHADEWEDFQSGKGEKTRVYRADESGLLVEGELVGGEFKPSRRYLWWVVGAIVGLVILAVIALVYRSRRRRAAALFPCRPPEPTGGL